MSKIKIKESTLTEIAEAIRYKDGTQEPISPDKYAERVRAIPQGPKMQITKQPEDIYGALYAIRNISIAAVGTGLTYQWQISNDNGTTWFDSTSTGYDSNTLTVTIGNTQFNGRLYRCKVTDVDGDILYSDTSMCIIKSSFANTAQIKAGTENINTIVPANQHISVFYAMAKAAGDNTQSQSSNPVGEYTAEAIEKIREMLGIVIRTQSQYDSIPEKDPNTFYFISDKPPTNLGGGDN